MAAAAAGAFRRLPVVSGAELPRFLLCAVRGTEEHDGTDGGDRISLQGEDMVEGLVRVATATPRVTVADPFSNAENILALMKEAAEEEARLLVLPELALTAYTCQDLFFQEALRRESREAFRRLLWESRDLPVLTVVGLPFYAGDKLYNAAAVICRGEVLGIVPKRNLPNYGEFYEKRWFSEAPETAMMVHVTDYPDGIERKHRVPFGSWLLFTAEDMPMFRLGVEICEDVWVAETPSTRLALSGATVLANSSASTETVGKSGYRRSLISQTSARLVAAYLYANAGEGESSQDLVFGGQNLICENGTVLCESRRFMPGIQFTEIDVSRLQSERRKKNTYGSESAAEEEGLVQIVPFRFAGRKKQTRVTASLSEESGFNDYRFREINPHPFVPGKHEERAERCEEILSIQAMGLKKRLEHIGCRSAVIGISGGLDSTLALLVTVRAFDLLEIPRKNILSVTMPAFGTTDRTYRNACRLTSELGATLREIDIKKAVMQHFSDIGHDPALHDVTYENGQARERTQVLMDLANELDGIVIGTGDLSELALGWATYNGDHMSMYGVNAGVPKTLIRHLVRYEAEAFSGEVEKVLLDVLDTPVSPELLPPGGDGSISQKTEDLVGPYELHDFYLYQVLRFSESPKKIYQMARRAFAGSEYDDATLLKWLKKFYYRFFRQQFKRSCLPDGPKVGSVSVSPRGDLRMPSDASVRAWIRELEEL